MSLTREELLARDREYGRRYRQKDPERARAKVKRWADRDPDHAKAVGRDRMKRWRAANPEKTHAWRKAHPEQDLERSRETARKWRDSNRDKYRAQGHRRREREYGFDRLYEDLDSWDCLVCQSPIEPSEKWHWDHEPALAWLARNKGYDGPYVKGRAHAHCNLSKGDRRLAWG